MFEFITDKQERGQVGIGTLIVFIAMVLVAAIAAGVLINTAGFLQSQAEATGEESTDLVSERIDVTSTVGIVGDDDQDGLSEIRISVAGSPGADQIDLSETTIQAVGPNGQANLVFTDRDAEGEEFNYEGDQDDEFALQINQGEFVVLKNDEIVEDGDAVINEDDQFTIVVNPAAEPFGSLDDSDSSDGVFEENEASPRRMIRKAWTSSAKARALHWTSSRHRQRQRPPSSAHPTCSVTRAKRSASNGARTGTQPPAIFLTYQNITISLELQNRHTAFHY